MTNRGSLTILTGIGLVLFVTSQVLAQGLIEGWHKAKFGMTLEELGTAYRQEEIYIPGFWSDNKMAKLLSERSDGPFTPAYPFELSTFGLTVLGEQSEVLFYFLCNHLAKIEIAMLGETSIHALVTPEKLQDSQELETKIANLRSSLVDKYGQPFKEKEQAVVKRKRTTQIVWKDDEGNTITLWMDFQPVLCEDVQHVLLNKCLLIYSDKGWTGTWEKIEAKLGEVRMENF